MDKKGKILRSGDFSFLCLGDFILPGKYIRLPLPQRNR